MRVTPAGFAGLTRLLVDLARETCRGRVVFCLEGGYDPASLCASVLAMIDELTDRSATDVAAMAAGADMARVRPVIDRCRHIHRRFWTSLDAP
jgi:acetoin utilization deacetylase AcuC-like enzyme